MLNEFNDIYGFLKEFDEHLAKEVSFYIIGGAVLLHRGMKESTKDIDVILSNHEEFEETMTALSKLDFIEKNPTQEYSRMNLDKIYEKGNLRFDIFYRKVCNKFSLTREMERRSEEVLKCNKLSVFFCSNEDIFLFKTMTERDVI